jgi:hypothetical protein
VNMTALRVSNLGRGFCVVGSRTSQVAWVADFANRILGNMRLALLKVVSCGYGVAVEGLRRDRLLFGLYLKD